MTGIERLRELVAGINPITVVFGVTMTAYDRKHKEVAGVRLRDFLADIAGQIERERDEERSRWDDELCDAQMDKTCVMAVYLEMNRHVLGHEGMEDSPVARWARELRAALGGDVRGLTDEDREAISWVRDHGGLDSVRKLLDWVVGHCSTKQQLDFDFWLSGRVMHELGFDEDMADRDEVERRLLARLMPEGMEWPMVDGEPVVIGERLVGYGSDDDGYEVVGVRPTCGWVLVKSCDHIHRDGGPVILEWDASKCHRPAPKVPDADGVEIRVGDTVYLLPGDWCDKFPLLRCHEWDAMKVLRLRPNHNTGRIECGTSPGSVVCYPYPSQLTHRAPVLAADGRPLEEGQTVWEAETGDGYVVERIYSGTTEPDFPGHTVACRRPGDIVTHMFRPSQLTHERPDSWERLEEDAGKEACEYFAHMPCGCETSEMLDETVEKCNAAKARDIVRRAKALEERDGS